MKRFLNKVSGFIKSITLIDSLILIFLLSITVFMLWYSVRENTTQIMQEEISQELVED